MNPTPSTQEAWIVPWAMERISKLDFVTACTHVGGQVIEVERDRLPTVRIACASADPLDAAVVEGAIGGDQGASFLLNVKKDALVTGSALDAAEAHGAAIGGMGDAMRALRDEADPSGYVHPNTRFVERGLRQHDGLRAVERLDRGRYRLTTTRGDTIVVVVNFEYEVSADAVRSAVDRYAEVDAVVTSNPNGPEISRAAVEVGERLGVAVYRWPAFYGSLNRRWP